MDSNLTYTPSP